MRKRLERITLGMVALWASWTVGLVPAEAAEKIKVLIVDGQNNHDWRATTPHLKRILEESGRFAADVATSPPAGRKEAMEKFRPDFNQYDVVLSNYNGEPWPEPTRKALEEYVANGKGLVIIHAANNSFPGWGEYNRMIGMGWRENKFGNRLTLDADGKEKTVPKGEGPGAGHGKKHAFAVIVRDAEHPITRGMPREWLHAPDELYHGMRGPVQNVHLLATAFSDKATGGTGEHEPMLWILAYDKGRVFHTPMGHDLDGMRCQGFITTVLRGSEWAATGNVTIPIPENFPTDKEQRSIK
jgi:type 1 glutamine amidotransferase